MSKMSEIHAEITKHTEAGITPFSEGRVNIAKIMRDPSTRFFLKHVYTSAQDRDIVDAINDLEIVLHMLKQDLKDLSEG